MSVSVQTQQPTAQYQHQIVMKFFGVSRKVIIVLLLTAVVFSAACGGIVKTDQKTARLLKTEEASRADLLKEVDRFARVGSMQAKMYLKFEDNSFAEFGNKEVYRSADGEIVVQRPASIRMKVQVPVIKSDVAQMTSDGKSFRVAILQDGGSGKYKKFVKGTNSADYTKLQKNLNKTDLDNGQAIKESVNAFANLRPQHFTDAMLVRPIEPANTYTVSSIFQSEEDTSTAKKSPLRTVMRGYYLLDELVKREDGTLQIERRFWFDRVGGIRLARLQLFDKAGEIESDITYGMEGNLTSTGNYNNLPLEILVTRPKEKYSMRLKYQTPEDVKIGSVFPETAFVLQNSWNLEEVDLDAKLRETSAAQPATTTPPVGSKFQP